MENEFCIVYKGQADFGGIGAMSFGLDLRGAKLMNATNVDNTSLWDHVLIDSTSTCLSDMAGTGICSGPGKHAAGCRSLPAGHSCLNK